MSFSRRSCINFIDVVARAPHDHHRRVVSIYIVYLCSFASSFMCSFDNDTPYKNMLSVHLVVCKFLTKFWNFCAIHRNVHFSLRFQFSKELHIDIFIWLKSTETEYAHQVKNALTGKSWWITLMHCDQTWNFLEPHPQSFLFSTAYV